MNENTSKLIEQLAAKLGTTSQYLWSILLKQAAVSATVTLIQMILIFGYGYVLYRIHLKLLKKKSDDKYAENIYESTEGGAAVPMIMGGLLFIILATMSLCSIGDIVNGYVNPEYWALNKVLDTIK